MATLDLIRTLTLRAKAEGFIEAQKQVRELGDSYEKSSKQQLSVDKSLQSLQRRYDQEFRAQQDLTKVARTLDLARAQGLITQQRQVELMRQAIVAHNTSAQSVKLHAAALTELGTAATSSAQSLAVIGGVLTRMGPIGIAAGAALAAVGGSFVLLSKAALEFGDQAGQLRDASETIGFSVEQLQALRRAGAQTGVGTEQLNTALERFSVSLAEIQEQSGKAFEAIERINPGLARQVSAAQSVQEAWDLVAEALRGAEREERNLAARAIFGRGGVGVSRLTAATEAAGGVEAYTMSLREADLVSQQLADRTDDLTDTIRENMHIANTIIVKTFAEPVLEKLEELSEKWVDLARTFQETDWSAVISGLSTVAGWMQTFVHWIDVGTSAYANFVRQLSGLPALVPGGGATGAPAGVAIPFPFAPPATGSAPGLPDPKALEQRARTARETANEYQRLIERTRDHIEALELEIKTINMEESAAKGLQFALQAQQAARKAGVTINQQEVDALRQRLELLERTKEQLEKTKRAADEAARAISQGFGDAVIGVVNGTQTMAQAFDSFTKQVLKSLTEMIVKLTIVNQIEAGLKPLLQGFGSFLSPTATVPAAVGHTGGIVGVTPFPTRYVHPPYFDDVPRLHNGLASDEMFAILQRGERVIPKSGTGVTVQVTNQVINNASNLVSARTTSEDDGRGGRKNTIVIDEIVSSAISRTGSRSSMAAQSAGRLVRR